ncbi:hypothetical protein ROZALSC1DRAFT_12723 [Rozella allomycis CSF55]|uniref:Ribonuclease P/MRP protein subunit POP5 n=1 Tax=Rozella allomycis (strain CSF55) TaxID=988480 RepID=A0A4V1J060_ROZAC|nr:hypothetical protein ROZALSC1DRAFT_12723 [Rozella allomycis CSF55]
MVRFKNRYILYEITFKDGKIDSTLSDQMILKHLKDVVQLYFGNYGMCCLSSSLSSKYFNPYTLMGLIRAPREFFRLAWFGLSMLSSIYGRTCSIRVIHVGGTIRSCQKELLAKNKEFLKVACFDKEESYIKAMDSIINKGIDQITA